MAPSPVTISGYALKDVMDSLEQRMIARDYDYVCLMVAEIVCSNHVRRLVSHLVCMLSQRYLTRNIGLLESVWQRLEAIDRRKYNGRERAVRAAAVEAALLLARAPSVPISFQKYIDCEKDPYAPNHPSRHGPPPNSLNLAPPSAPHVESVVSSLYDAMTYMLDSGANEFGPVAKLLQAATSLDQNYKDVIETLWEMVCVFVKYELTPRVEQSENVSRYIECCQRTYWLGLTKIKRKERLNLLWGCVYMVCKNKMVVGDISNSVVPLPAYDLDALYLQVDGSTDLAVNHLSPAAHAHHEPIFDEPDTDKINGFEAEEKIDKILVKVKKPRGRCLDADESKKIEYLMYYTDFVPSNVSDTRDTIQTVTKVVNVNSAIMRGTVNKSDISFVVLDKQH
jgi:hypothetical protein